MRLIHISYIICFSILAVGCSRKVEEVSNISIQTGGSQKIGALMALPVGRDACYGVSIKGSGITGSSATACRPETGLVFGFVPAGGTLQGDVLKGSSRTFDVYLYLKQVGDLSPCPSMGASFASLPADQLYHIGTQVANLEKDSETINITTVFPGETQNLVVQKSYSANCLPTTNNKSGFQLSSGFGVSSGTGYKMQARVGRSNSGSELTGTGYKLIVKE